MENFFTGKIQKKSFSIFFFVEKFAFNFLSLLFSVKPAVSAKPVLPPLPTAKKAPSKKTDSSSESSDEEPVKPTGQFVYRMTAGNLPGRNLGQWATWYRAYLTWDSSKAIGWLVDCRLVSNLGQ